MASLKRTRNDLSKVGWKATAKVAGQGFPQHPFLSFRLNAFIPFPIIPADILPPI
jgi:hypothetical protein